MKVSVVIPTLNEENYISDLIEDLENQVLKPFEVIVVDGNSEDKTIEVIQKYKEVKIINSKRGVALQRNIGGDSAKGDIICFLDADTRIRPDFLDDLITDFRKRKLQIACPLFIPYNSTFLVNLLFWFLDVVFVLLQKILPSGAGPCIIIRKDIFCRNYKNTKNKNKNNKFNEDIKFEDMEFIRRVGRRFKFGIILKPISVSDRRFKKTGFIRMLFLYILLCFLFLFGMFRVASFISYPFGNYKKVYKKNYKK